MFESRRRAERSARRVRQRRRRRVEADRQLRRLRAAPHGPRPPRPQRRPARRRRDGAHDARDGERRGQPRGAGGDVRAHAQNGGLNVRLTGTHWEGAGLDAETQNGGVRLVVPEGYSARLTTGTVNGGMRTDIPITVSGTSRASSRSHLASKSGDERITAQKLRRPAPRNRERLLLRSYE